MSKIVIASLLLVVTLPVHADQDYIAARSYIKNIVDELTAEVKANTDTYANDQEKLFALIETKVFPSIDILRFSKITLGKHWRAASVTQQEVFQKALRDTLLKSYGKSLVLLSQVEEIKFPDPSKAASGKKFKIVTSKLLFEGGQKPIAIGYVAKRQDGQWRVIDLIIEGVSMAKQLRQSFDREISEKGLNALITRLSSQSSLN